MATAPVSKSANNQPALDKNGAPIRVVTPDQQGNFQLKIGKGDIAKVHIVDVDMVLYLNDGTKLVLAGGAIGAMDDTVMVDFSNGRDSAAHMMDQVGIIPLQKLDQPRVLSTEPQGGDGRGNMQEEASYRQTEGAQDLAAQAQAANAAISAISKAMVQLANVVQSNSQPVNNFKSNYEGTASQQQPLVKAVPQVLPERPGVTPQEFVIGPNAPALSVHLTNTVGSTQDGLILKGSGGSSAFQSDTNTSNIAQIAPQIINAGNDVNEIWANGQAPTGNTPDGTFSKILDVQITGDGKVQSLTISGVPANMTIVGATFLGNGVYQIAVLPDTKNYKVELRYNTVEPNANAPIHQDFKLNFELAVVTTEGIQVLNSVRQVVLKDATTADDLNYANPVTGESALVLPAQGISHVVHAGDNAGTTIYGSNANDFLYGGTGNDTLYGGKGNTYFQGGAGDDKIVGGVNTGGTNINTVGYTNSTSGVTVDLSTGNALDGFGGHDTLQNIQKVIGSAHDDTFIVGANTKGVDGGSGGKDTIDFSASNAAVTVNLSTGTGTGGYAQNVTFTNIENVVGSSFDDTFIASSAENIFDGGAGGSNTVSYANSPSSSTSGVTVDLLNGVGSGNDATGDKYINIQNVIGSAYNDTFVANQDANHFDGMGGVNTVSYAGSATGVEVDFYKGQGSGGNATGDSYKNIQNVIGSSFDDKFVADTDSLNFDGGAGGTDTVSYERYLSGVIVDASRNVGGIELTPAVGNTPATYSNSYTNIDKFVGTAYADTFIASNRADNFDGLGGVDTVSYAADTVGVVVNLVTGLGSGAGSLADGDRLANIENVIGGSGNDTFIANDSANVFDGGAGSNTVDYSESTTGAVTVDLFHANGVGTSGGFAQGDKFINIQNVIGSTFDDTFVASAAANTFDGAGGNHNRVSYANDTVGVTVDLVNGQGSGVGSLAAGDKFFNIQDATGGSGNDTFIASNVANAFNGGSGTNTVSYEYSDAGVTVDLVAGTGTGGYADGDTLTNIQNVKGSTSDDLFIANSVANSFVGNGGVDTVSYIKATDGNGVTVDLNAGVGTGGYAEGDRYDGIRNATGTSYDDTFVASNLANTFDGGLGSNTVSYAASDSGVTVNLLTGVGTGGYAQDDRYISIQNAIGSASDDLFIANGSVNRFDGGLSTAASHNRVSYATDTADLTIDLLNAGVAGIGGNAEGDTYVNIQDVTGGLGNDTFIASTAANNFDGGGGTHNRVSYATDTANLTIDLLNPGAIGIGGNAQGDTYTNIQDITGGSGDDTFIASTAANNFDGGTSTATSHNRVSYASDTAKLTIDLLTVGAIGLGGNAQGDTYTNIQDITGGSGDDLFIANGQANRFDGGTSTVTSHNRVSYATDTADLTINLLTPGAVGIGGNAAGDTYVNIQDITGGSGNDTFIASAAANAFDGGTSTATSHNRVSYASDTANLTIDLLNPGAIGIGGNAQGDTYTNIQDITGGSGDDTFIASAAANNFDGGTSTATSHNRVSYATDTADLTIDLLTAGAIGVGGNAQGDTYTNIQDLTGGLGNDTFIASAAANAFDGGGGTHNRVSYATDTADLTIDLLTAGAIGVGGNAQGDTYTNIQDLTGGLGNDTFIASAAANAFDGGGGTHNRVSYATDTADLTIDLLTAGATGVGGNAQGDTYTNIQDLTGGLGNDTFIASAAANAFDGGGGTHNRVSYATDTADLTIDLLTAGAIGVGGNAQGDTYTNIQDLTGGLGNDTFIASAAANAFDGGGGTHNRVSYATDTANLIINLSDKTASGVTAGTGSAGYAAGDTYTNIQDATGGSGNDIFVASLAANSFDGGAGSNTVSYASSVGGVTVNLSSQTVGGVASSTGSGSYADGDVYTNIQNVIGSTGNDTFIGGATVNTFTGNGGSDTVSYAASTAGVKVNLSGTALESVGAGRGVGGDADNDTYVGISNVTGSLFDDVFFANNSVNTFDGGGGTLHNRVSYAASSTGIIVNLSDKTILGVNAGRGSLGEANNDTYINIQDVTGTTGNDTFIASAAENIFDGGLGNNTVNYGASDAGVIVNLSAVTQNGVVSLRGSGGYANNDAYTNIQNVTGSLFDDLFYGSSVANIFDGGTGSLHNRVNYANDTANLVINLSDKTASGANAGKGLNGNAAGDTYINIQDATGGSGNDTFVASSAENRFDGGAGSDTVSYASSDAPVIVNLSAVTLGGVASMRGSGGYANNDEYTSIENVIGSSGNDTFYASADTAAAANRFDGGGGTHNRVSYEAATADLTVNLITNAGSGGALGDTYANIQDVTGGAGNDTFVANSSVNFFDGGGGTHNRVNYASDTTALIINLSDKTASGVAAGTGSGGNAAGDTYTNIQDATGGSGNDTFIASLAENRFDGGAGSDTVSYASSDAPVIVNFSAVTLGGVASMRGSGGYANNDEYTSIENVIGSSGNDIFYASADTAAAANKFDGGGGTQNRVSYEAATADLLINLFNGAATLNGVSVAANSGAGGAAGDTYANIQDVAGGSGNDTFNASAVTNRFDGGNGVNTVSYQSLAGPVNIDIKNMTGTSAFQNGYLFYNIQNLIGTAGNDTLGGAAGGNSTLTGGAGADVLTGYGTNNTTNYAGNTAALTINLSNAAVGGVAARSGKGGDAEGDTYTNIQNVIGGSGSDLFIASSDTNAFNGGAGNNTVSYAGSTAGVVANLNTTTGSTGDALGDTFVNIQNLTGTAFADKLTGLAAGGSILIGGAGADQLIGLGYNGNAATANTANYAGSTSGVTINLSGVTVDVLNPLGGLAAGAGRGGDAEGDTLSGIQNLVGSSFNDTFYASSQINIFNGGVSDATSHNRVVYTNTTGDMTINLSDTTVGSLGAGRGSGGDADQDTYINIQDVTGGGGNDTFIGGAAANYFDGGGGSNTVSYAGNTTAVTVDLFHGTGTGGYAQGDTYANIQNVIGSSGNDLFYASTVANNFNGGSAGNDTVSYKYSTGAPIVASLATGLGTGGDANGDRYTSIENLTGSENVDSTLTGDGLANILTSLGLNNTNVLDGGAGNDTIDGRLGGHNSLYGGLGEDTFFVQATGGVMTNITAINGGGGTSSTTYAASTFDTLKIFGLTTAEPVLNMTNFLDGKVSSINRIDVTGDGTSTKLLFSAEDVQALVGLGNGPLTVMLDNAGAKDTILANGFVESGQNYFAFYSDATYTHEIARINVQYV